MNNTKHRSPFAIAARLIVLVQPMLPIMLAAIVMGVIGHFCATFITVFGGFALLTAAGLPSPLAGVGTAFACILVFALLRGVLRYAEQASNHYIAFKLLALIRDQVFGALRRLTPAKLEGRENADVLRAELTIRAAALREKLTAAEHDHLGTRRLLRAFPDMKSLNYADTLAVTRAAMLRLRELAAAAKNAARETAANAKEKIKRA